MNRDARAQLLAALREIYDGAWTRHVGTDGGRTLHWAGKVGLVGGCTPTIDRHHAVMGAMGERFLLYRLPDVDPSTQAREALKHAGREREMRAELAQAISGLMAAGRREPRQLLDVEADSLVTLATLVVRARSAVERDGYSREIDLIPPAEAPTRLVVVLERLLAGLDAIGLDRPGAWRVVEKAALDSVPALRFASLAFLEAYGHADTNTIASAVNYPSSTTRRALEDLTAHGLVNCERQGQGKPHVWSLTGFAAERLATLGGTFPEKSSNTRIGIDKGEESLSGLLTFRERFLRGQREPAGRRHTCRV
jgi:DNA-binding transcriptional ArsR family regulator